jgi:two-component system OmpR family sensor kinase/two-component system sensor histidine kinase BaeS
MRVALSFAAVVVVAVGVAALLMAQGTRTEFGQYVQRGGHQRALALAPALADYYAQGRSWQGVGTYLATLGYGAAGSGQGQGRGMGMMGRGGGMMATDAVMLADAGGTVVADTTGASVGQTLSRETLSNGAGITVAAQLVGTVVVETDARGAPWMSGTLEQDYLESINRYLYAAGAVAAVVALLLGFFLSRRLATPLHAMTRAAGAMAAGDLSQRVQAQSDDEVGDLARAFNAMAESVAASQSQRRSMMADIAHELRTPLTVLQGNLEALRDGVVAPSPEALASLHEETLLLSRLVTDLKDLSLAEAGQLALHLEQTDLVDLARRTVEAMGAAAAERGVSLRVNAPVAVPKVSADRDRLSQVLRNLISNAIRYSSQGGTVRVDVASATRKGYAVQMVVSDDGPGITEDELALVFERFYRGDRSRARASGGAGLGLAIVKQLVQAHGGEAHAESEPGHGARFVVNLPAGAGNQTGTG